jgi:hypothetical protein
VAKRIAKLLDLIVTGVIEPEGEPPTCKHGAWRFAGADKKRDATKWRCPTGECKPASVWI